MIDLGEVGLAESWREGVNGSRWECCFWSMERGVQFQKIGTTRRALDPDVMLLQKVDRSAVGAETATELAIWVGCSG